MGIKQSYFWYGGHTKSFPLLIISHRVSTGMEQNNCSPQETETLGKTEVASFEQCPSFSKGKAIVVQELRFLLRNASI